MKKSFRNGYHLISIEGDKIYTESLCSDRKHVFTISEEYPLGYIVWNVPDDLLPKGYVPLARPNGKYTVDCKSLVAWKVSEDVWDRIMHRDNHSKEINSTNYQFYF